MALQAADHYLQLAVIYATSTEGLLLFLLLIAIRLLLFGSVRATTSESTKHKHLPPSPPGKLPIIGHLHQIGSKLHITFRDLAARHGHDGLLLLYLGSVPTVVVSSLRAAEAVLRTHDHVFSSRPRSAAANIIRYGSLDVTFAPYGEYWRQARKLVTTHMLSNNRVRSFRHGRQEEVRLVIAKIREAAGTVVDMSEILVGYTNDNVCRAVLGEFHREKGRNSLFRELTEINVALLGGFNLEDCFPRLAMVGVLRRMVCAKAERLRKRWDDLFDEIIEEHARSSKPSGGEKEENTADFVHVLLSVQEEYGLTRDNIKSILMDMFEAGIETSYLVLEYAMAELMNNKHIMTKLQEEVRMCTLDGKRMEIITDEDITSMTFLKATIKETLRLHPPAPFLIPHFSVADCEINGCFIPSGTRVLINTWALARDPMSWNRPEEFLPERFLQEGGSADVDMKGRDLQFVPFGAGRRICPGSNFAVATIEIMLANLLYHFNWDLKDVIKGNGAQVDMSESFGLTIRRKQKLYLVPRFSNNVIREVW
ncbi:hypothetical protein PR202_gb25838 [Eleusine coracana subsp. coracana]|uniref:Uncharacterized protein n=1 Tax=Eleusine coracana subsp. coracana TaxID=191504 RepID=A0AAV5FR31_ELECO|nr:hypothetical protein QOZ80_4BG0353930 [Eleusine coracana subsp. coracana]GJN36900.1 hypothetical protein PR202_gb25802 [Eleusine coracana subsp. coracana]GJN36933.1 hypothetical protein PR202_gb25838 [Eleusine coracana subsp. coracana]